MFKRVWNSLTIGAFVASMLLSASSEAQGLDSSNLVGQRGIMRSASAETNPTGFFSFGTDFQYFKQNDLTQTGQEASRLINSYSLGYTPFKFFEAAFTLHMISDDSTGSVDELQVVVGEPELTFKGSYEINPQFAVGGLFDMRVLSGVGYFSPTFSAVNFLVGALATYNGGAALPLKAHLNVGFLLDNSKNLFETDQERADLSSAQRFAAQLSTFNHFITRVGVEYVTTYVAPFIEYSLDMFVGSGAPGFSKTPSVLTLGLHGWPTEKRGLQLFAAVDIGLTGKGEGEDNSDPLNNQYAYVTSKWNVLFGASYRFDPFAGDQIRTVEVVRNDGTTAAANTDVKLGTIAGSVLDASSDKPVANATVLIDGEDSSGLAVNPADGTFRSYKLAAGKKMLTVSAEGYEPSKLEVDVQPGAPAAAAIKLKVKTSFNPGTLRGTVKIVGGKKVAGATILIPEADQTVNVDEEGNFSISLKPGEYSVVVSSPGARSQTKKVRIGEGSTIILNVELYR